MPAIWTFGPEHTTGIDLGANAFWRIMLGETRMGHVECLSLVLIYPPAAGQTIQHTQISLARVPIPLTDKAEDILKVAQTSISTGTVEKDRERMTEVFNMFKNGRHIKQEILDLSLKDGLVLLDGYWTIRNWLMGGAQQPEEVKIGDYVIKLIP